MAFDGITIAGMVKEFKIISQSHKPVKYFFA